LVLLDDVSLALPARGITVIMGPNGAGKSILLRTLHGILDPSSGVVQRPDDHQPMREAMVFQRPVLLRRSVLANVAFAARKVGSAPRRDPAGLLRQAGLDDRASQPAHALSGGEQQRLALACALARCPTLLFLDEPAANLDPASTAQIETAVKEAAAAGTKIVFVTHDLGQARRLADDVAFLHKGRLTEQSPAADFFDAPRSTAARTFLAGELLTD
ncbi:MAG: ATP-binding cassette domain-containing protein, partial [Pseudomonadota bacterium]